MASTLTARTQAVAQSFLTCGWPVRRHLEAGAANTYDVTVGAGSKLQVDAADLDGGIGPLKLRAAGQESCGGTLQLAGPIAATITVSACDGTGAGDYTISATVVTPGPDTCAPAMPCGLVPYARRFRVPGETDAYTFAGRQGETIQLRAGDISGVSGSIRVRLFDPSGALVSGSDSCGPVADLPLPSAGTYTVLVSPCGSTPSSLYSLSFSSSACPAGPEITYFGVAQANGTALSPVSYDPDGRPIYRAAPAGFFLVIESRPGRSSATVGRSAYTFSPSDPGVRPDLQVLLSRPLGDGSLAVCDALPPSQGGVPGSASLEYANQQATANAINDFGCRVDDGTGRPQGVSVGDACTYFQDVTNHFVDPTSTVQFCAQIAYAWSFPRGLTVIEARTRDVQGVVGPSRQIVVQVGTDRCPGDCNGDVRTTVEDLLTGIAIALGRKPADRCPNADMNDDGSVTVDEVLLSVRAATDGCP
ncbi:MAG: hypothetical protein U0587_22395 [Candidatus Binatia bacterium]